MTGEAIAARVAEVRGRIERAARAAGRDPAEVRLVAVSKNFDAQAVIDAVAAGVTEFGENRAQELVAKAATVAASGTAVPGVPVWHFVGRLQRNKVRALAPIVAWWQSIDRLEVGEIVARHAPGARVLVQVNAAGESTKGGCAPADAPGLVAALRDLGLRVEGLMTVPPAAEDPRHWFAALSGLADRLGLPERSMGMTGDFEVAVAEGATMVRVGTAIFGPRPVAEAPRR